MNKMTDPAREQDGTVTEAALIELASRFLRYRSRRSQRFGNDLFADPAWEILLYLFVAGGNVSVNSVCSDSSLPASTAMRWLDFLEQRGLVEQYRDHSAGDERYVRMSSEARGGVSDFLLAWDEI